MSINTDPKPGTDCREDFKAAYENRYTWHPSFSGYRGRCIWEQGKQHIEGSFSIGADLKANVEGIADEAVQKAVASQLWEVAIHRVRRSFDQIHGQNTFTAGTTNAVGTEVIVGGKNSGDRYRIKDRVVTMVHRHIHNTIVTIFTKNTVDTGNGYLSSAYSSYYVDPITGKQLGCISHFQDVFTLCGDTQRGLWILTKRIIEAKADINDQVGSQQTFQFLDCCVM